MGGHVLAQYDTAPVIAPARDLPTDVPQAAAGQVQDRHRHLSRRTAANLLTTTVHVGGRLDIVD